jgi:hypothetical protein
LPAAAWITKPIDPDFLNTTYRNVTLVPVNVTLVPKAGTVASQSLFIGPPNQDRTPAGPAIRS